LEAIHVWHSGGRGPHVTIPARVIGADAGHPQLPRIYAAMVQHLFPPHVAPTLDRGIYNGGLGGCGAYRIVAVPITAVIKCRSRCRRCSTSTMLTSRR
jgi:hypothetical protein